MKFKTKNLLENKFVLYLVFFIALVTVFSYIVTNNYAPVLLFLLISILTYYFSKNMIVILGAAIIGTHVVSLLNGTNIFNGGNREGFENNTYKIIIEPEQETYFYNKNKGFDLKIETNDDRDNIEYTYTITNEASWMSISGDHFLIDGSNSDMDNDTKTYSVTLNAIPNNNGEPNGEPIIHKTITFTRESESFTNQGLTPSALNIPSVDNLAAKDDTAKKKEKAYDLLESALGGADSKEMKAMAGNTKDLLGKQVQLMDQMKQITPILQQTMGLVNNLDLSSLTSMADKYPR